MQVHIPRLQHTDTDLIWPKGTYLWRSIPLGLDASTQILSKVCQLHHWSLYSVVMTLDQES